MEFSLQLLMEQLFNGHSDHVIYHLDLRHKDAYPLLHLQDDSCGLSGMDETAVPIVKTAETQCRLPEVDIQHKIVLGAWPAKPLVYYIHHISLEA